MSFADDRLMKVASGHLAKGSSGHLLRFDDYIKMKLWSMYSESWIELPPPGSDQLPMHADWRTDLGDPAYYGFNGSSNSAWKLEPVSGLWVFSVYDHQAWATGDDYTEQYAASSKRTEGTWELTGGSRLSLWLYPFVHLYRGTFGASDPDTSYSTADVTIGGITAAWVSGESRFRKTYRDSELYDGVLYWVDYVLTVTKSGTTWTVQYDATLTSVFPPPAGPYYRSATLTRTSYGGPAGTYHCTASSSDLGDCLFQEDEDYALTQV